MSPLKIAMLLHYASRTNDYKEAVDVEHARSPAVAEALRWFVEQGLMTCRYGDYSWASGLGAKPQEAEGTLFSIADKGLAMVDALKAV